MKGGYQVIDFKRKNLFKNVKRIVDAIGDKPILCENVNDLNNAFYVGKKIGATTYELKNVATSIVVSSDNTFVVDDLEQYGKLKKVSFVASVDEQVFDFDEIADSRYPIIINDLDDSGAKYIYYLGLDSLHNVANESDTKEIVSLQIGGEKNSMISTTLFVQGNEYEIYYYNCNKNESFNYEV